MSSTFRAHIAVLFTNIFFAANFSLVKMISPSLVGPLAVNVLRATICVALFWLVWSFGKTEAGIRKQDWGRFFLCGLTGVALNQVLFIKGLTLTSATHAAFLMLVTPLMVTIFAVWALRESFTFTKASGLFLGIGGSVFLILQKETADTATNYVLGDLLIIINAISYAIYFILVKPLMQHYSPLHVIRWVFTLGTILIIPVGWNETMEINWQGFEGKHWAALATMIFTGTFLAYYFNAYGIQHIGAGATGTYIYTQPVFAVIIASIFLNESLSWQKALAASLIFTGVYLVSFHSVSRKAAKNP